MKAIVTYTDRDRITLQYNLSDDGCSGFWHFESAVRNMEVKENIPDDLICKQVYAPAIFSLGETVEECQFKHEMTHSSLIPKVGNFLVLLNDIKVKNKIYYLIYNGEQLMMAVCWKSISAYSFVCPVENRSLYDLVYDTLK